MNAAQARRVARTTARRAAARAVRAARTAGRSAALPLTGPRVLATPAGRGGWALVLGAAPMGPAARARWASRVADRVAELDRPAEAAALLERAARRLPSGPSREGLRAGAALLDLRAGRVPGDLGATVRALVAEADTALRRTGPAAAAAPAARAAEVAFHRTLHFDGLTSPLGTDPEGWLAPLRDSAVWPLLGRPRGRREPASPGGGTAGRPHRLLLVTFKNHKFLTPIEQEYAARPDVEVRTVDLADVPAGVLPLSPLQQLRLRLTGPDDARDAPWAEHLRPHLEWADTVFVDWLQRAAVLVTSLDPGRTRVVVRLHSFEAFTVFPHLVDYSRVDDVVVVGPHLGRLLHRIAPASASARLTLLPNAADLRRFERPKDDDARFTLALVGWGVVAKDPLWALEVLALLRARDERYRLVLVGAALDEDPRASPEQRRYAARFADRRAEPDVAGAVETVPFTTDVPAVLTRAGVVLSSSVRESFHLGLVEGAASGAVPVVRNWPLFAAVGGPQGLFPDDWIVATAQQAADRVLTLTSDEGAWRAAGEAARDWVVARYDWTATRPAYDDLLLAPPPTS